LAPRIQLAVTLFEGAKLVSIDNLSGPEPLFLVYSDHMYSDHLTVGHRDLFEYQAIAQGGWMMPDVAGCVI